MKVSMLPINNYAVVVVPAQEDIVLPVMTLYSPVLGKSDKFQSTCVLIDNKSLH